MEFELPKLRQDFYWEERMAIFEKLKKRSIIDPITGCYLWQGNRSKNGGYGVMMFKLIGSYNRPLRVHRLSAYVYFITSIEDQSITVNHKHDICSNKHCWCPDHVYEGTPYDNVHDAINDRKHYSFIESAKTHCPHGHEYTQLNTRIDIHGKRYCRACDKQRNWFNNHGIKLGEAE